SACKADRHSMSPCRVPPAAQRSVVAGMVLSSRSGASDMADVLFTNVRVFDGGGEAPFTGDVLVQGNKISRVVKTAFGQRSPPIAGAQVIDGAGAFLMPGMVEAHTHFSWNDQPS